MGLDGSLLPEYTKTNKEESGRVILNQIKHHCFVGFKKQAFILEQFQIYVKIPNRVQSCHTPLAQFALLLTSHTYVVFFFWQLNQFQYIIIKFIFYSSFLSFYLNEKFFPFLFQNATQNTALHLVIMSPQAPLICDSFSDVSYI